MDQSEDAGSTQRKREGVASKAKNCAECRRLKIKCDRQVPCANCVKRGTSSICPDGHLLPKGQRLILASTELLHSQIDQLTDRIRELESALSDLQAQHSDEPHPLLSNPDDLPISSFGSLMIKDGNARFFGATSSVEWVMAMQEGVEGESSPPPNGPEPAHISLGNGSLVDSISAEFPLPMDGLDYDSMMKKAITELPRKEKAIVLVDCYYLRAAWEMSPIPRTRLINEYIVPCYDSSPNSGLTLQEYALIYAILALGMLHNPEAENYRQVADKYSALARACLAVGDFILNPSLSAIDALIICVSYHHNMDDRLDGHKGWVLLGVALKLAVGMGLHREPSLWGLPEKECMRRRRTMWELVSCDLWASLITGRPPMLSRQHFDVKVPLEAPDATDSDPNFSRGKHYFSDMCLWQVLDLGLASSNKATYSAVLKVDTKIRNWNLPKAMQARTYEPSEREQTVANFRDTTGLIFKEITLLCLHRAYFACALLEPPYDPLGGMFARSVLAAYGSACAILGGIRALYAKEPILMMRFVLFWTHGFSAAVALGSIAIRAPDCTLAPTALVEFDAAVDMFKRARASYRANRVLPTLLRLQEKAHVAFNSFRAGTWTKPTSTDQQLQQGMGGSASVQHVRSHSQAVPSVSIPEGIMYQPPEEEMQQDMMSSLEGVQPSLDDYLRAFDLGNLGGQPEADYDGNGGVARGAHADIGRSVTSSDDFLHGVLTGQWAVPPSSFQSSSSADFGYYQTDRTQQRVPTVQGQQSDQYDPSHSSGSLGYGDHSFRPSPGPPSDGVLSSHGSPPGHNLEGGHSLFPPSLSYQHPTSTIPIEGDSQANFMWDNFLKELGIQGNAA